MTVLEPAAPFQFNPGLESPHRGQDPRPDLDRRPLLVTWNTAECITGVKCHHQLLITAVCGCSNVIPILNLRAIHYVCVSFNKFTFGDVQGCNCCGFPGQKHRNNKWTGERKHTALPIKLFKCDLAPCEDVNGNENIRAQRVFSKAMIESEWGSEPGKFEPTACPLT